MMGVIPEDLPPFLRSQSSCLERISLSLLRGRPQHPDFPRNRGLEGERAMALSGHHASARNLGTTMPGPALPEDQKERILGQIGETIAEVQRVAVLERCPAWNPRCTSSCQSRSRMFRASARASTDCANISGRGLDDILRDAPARYSPLTPHP